MSRPLFDCKTIVETLEKFRGGRTVQTWAESVGICTIRLANFLRAKENEPLCDWEIDKLVEESGRQDLGIELLKLCGYDMTETIPCECCGGLGEIKIGSIEGKDLYETCYECNGHKFTHECIYDKLVGLNNVVEHKVKEYAPRYRKDLLEGKPMDTTEIVDKLFGM